MNDDNERREAIDHLSKLICDIPVAMLTTSAADHSLRSRPMVNVHAKFDGDLWFFSHDDDPKTQEIQANPNVNVCFVEPGQHRYVSVSGNGSVVKDQKRNELLWSTHCEPWFPDGLEDLKLSLIKVDVENAEYWDRNRNAMVAVGSLLRRLVGGESSPEVQHEKVDWNPS